MEHVRKTVKAGSRTDLNFGVPMNRKRPSGWKYCSAFRDTSSQRFVWGRVKVACHITLYTSKSCESSDSLKKLEVYLPLLGKLKSLYAYLIGKHINKLIRKSVPYACFPSGSSLGCMLDCLHQEYAFGKPHT